MVLYKLREISYQYPASKQKVLKDINVDIEQGKFYFLTGCSGAGKTTFCLMLSGLIPFKLGGKITGKFHFSGKNIENLTFDDFVGKVGFVMENPLSQISGIKSTIREEIAFGLENLGIPKNDINEEIEKISKKLELSKIINKNPYNISSGQQQKVVIASVLAMRPDIIILDEPTSMLDFRSSRKLFEILHDFKKQGLTIIIVEQKIEEVAEFADRVFVFDDGQIIADGGTEVLTSPLLEKREIPPSIYTQLAREWMQKGLSETQFILPVTLPEARSWFKKFKK